MSYELTSLSFKQKGISSSEQQVLSILAFRANDDAECWPSVKSLHSDSKLDRKVILNCLSSLIEKKLILKTGEMKGRTKSVPVYKLTLSSTQTGTAKNLSSTTSAGSSTKTGTAKQYQNRDMEYKDLNVNKNALAHASLRSTSKDLLLRSEYNNDCKTLTAMKLEHLIKEFDEWLLEKKTHS